MKAKIIFIFSLLCVSLAFSQNNLSRNAVNLLTVNSPTLGAQEIFRFRPGVVTQLDLGSDFGFGPTNKWFSLGRVNAGTQSFYGLRFQESSRAFVMGYTSTNVNPRIEWVGEGSTLGNLEFRAGNGFGVLSPNPNPGPGTNTLVATMTNLGNTVFGTTNPFGNTTSSPKVGVVTSNTNALALRTTTGTGLNVDTTTGLGINVNTNGQGMNINASGNTGYSVSTTGNSGFVAGGLYDTGGGFQDNYGLYMKTFGGQSATGIQSFAFDADNNIGVKGTTSGTGSFEAGIYGETPNNNGNNWAGFFDGDVFATGSGIFNGSDNKLKENIKTELNALEIINQLNPVTYDFKKADGLNLSSLKQHGFIAQELAEILPELTKDVNKPVFDREGKKVSDLSFKSVNYIGLISILTAGIQELNEEMNMLKEELASYIANDDVRKNLLENINIKAGFSMEQNVPNPFEGQTSIQYKLPNEVTQASISIFDLNGRLIKDYPITKNNGELIVSATEIGKGLFIYSLIQNGQEQITKKMIVK